MPEVVAVVGAGLMGAGIAQVAAQAGYEVRLLDVNGDSLDRGVATIRRSVARLADKGVVTEDVETVTARVIPTASMADFSTAFIGVEAVFEQLDIKQDVFRSLDEALPADAILATNTSALPITKLAQVTSRPDRVVGTHFFSPVPMMQLCELVRGEETSDQTLAQSRAFAENVGKTCVVVNRDIAGFVTTRLITALVVEASRARRGRSRHRGGRRRGLPTRVRSCHGTAGDHGSDRDRRDGRRRRQHCR